MVCGSAAGVSAQNQEAIDRLEQQLNTTNDGRKRTELLIGLCVEYRVAQLQTARRYGEEAVALATKVGNDSLLAEANKVLGLAFWFLGDYQPSLRCFEISEHLFTKLNNQRNMAATLRYQGIVLIDQGKLLTAMQRFNQGLQLARNANSQYEIAGCLNQMGVVYHKQRNFSTAMDYFNQALALYKELKNEDNIALCYSNVGLAYSDMGNYDQALHYQLMNLEIRLRGTNKRATAYAFRILGELYYHMRRYNASDSVYVQAIQLYKKLEVPFGETKCMIGLARNQQVMQKARAAAEIGELAMRKAKVVNSAELMMEASEVLASAYASLGKHEKAYENYRIFKAMSDSIVNAENARQIFEMRAQAELEKQQHMLEAQAEQARQQKIINYALAGCLLLTLALGSVLLMFFRRKERDLTLLEAKNHEIQQHREELLMRSEELQQSNGELSVAMETLRNTQQQLILSEKMAALGQLIANIAHEINSPISAIRTSARTSSRLLPQVFRELPLFLHTIDMPTQQLLIALVLHSANGSGSFSTREERQQRKAIADKLAGWGVANASEMASRIAAMQLRPDDLDAYQPLFHHAEVGALLNFAQQLTQFQLNNHLIERSADKTSRIVQALKSYAHTSRTGQKEAVQLAPSIEAALALYDQLLHQGVKVERDYQTLPDVPVFLDEIDQVWSKVLHNALLALTEQPEENRLLRIETRQEGDTAVVRIIDNGPGIAPHVLPRIFEPFFTTRPKGEGSGLGLDISRKIVERHGGTIEAESQPGRTVFTIRLPLHEPLLQNLQQEVGPERLAVPFVVN